MINQANLCFGQRIDESNWLIEPWLTNPAMDEIKTWDLKERKVLEFGAGNSSFWWANKCKEVVSVEANAVWFHAIENHATRNLYPNLKVLLREGNEGDLSNLKAYTDALDWFEPDIIVNDGILRTEICEIAVEYFKRMNGILICDNWDQDYVWISPKAIETMSPYEGVGYIQSNHTEHSGKPWQTKIWQL